MQREEIRLLRHAIDDPSPRWCNGVLNALEEADGVIVLARKDGMNFIAVHGLSVEDVANLVVDLLKRSPTVELITMVLLADGIVVVGEENERADY